MPTVKLIDGNTVQFIDSNGNVVAEQQYDDANGALEIVDGNNNTLPVSTGPIDTPSVNTEKADTRSGYSNVTASRSFDTIETNTTGSDLDVAITVRSEADNTEVGLSLNVDGIIVEQIDSVLDSGDDLSVSATVANGSDYEALSFRDTANFRLENWVEQQ